MKNPNKLWKYYDPMFLFFFIRNSEYFLICIFHYFQKLFIENLTEFKKKKAKIVINKSTVIVLCIT